MVERVRAAVDGQSDWAGEVVGIERGGKSGRERSAGRVPAERGVRDAVGEEPRQKQVLEGRVRRVGQPGHDDLSVRLQDYGLGDVVALIAYADVGNHFARGPERGVRGAVGVITDD